LTTLISALLAKNTCELFIKLVIVNYNKLPHGEMQAFSRENTENKEITALFFKSYYFASKQQV